ERDHEQRDEDARRDDRRGLAVHRLGTVVDLDLPGHLHRAARDLVQPRRRRPPRLPRPAQQAMTTATEDDFLRVRGLSVTLDTRTGSGRLLDDVTFAIRRGEAFGLVGESGSGKSMTA